MAARLALALAACAMRRRIPELCYYLGWSAGWRLAVVRAPHSGRGLWLDVDSQAESMGLVVWWASVVLAYGGECELPLLSTPICCLTGAVAATTPVHLA